MSRLLCRIFGHRYVLTEDGYSETCSRCGVWCDPHEHPINGLIPRLYWRWLWSKPRAWVKGCDVCGSRFGCEDDEAHRPF